jgi:hypothetical protein
MRITRAGILSAAALALFTVSGTAVPASIASAQGAATSPPAKKVLTPEEKAAADLEKGVKRAKVTEAFYGQSAPL